MKTNYLKSLLVIAMIHVSQLNKVSAQGVMPCGTDEKTNQYVVEHPELKQAIIDYNREIDEKINEKGSRSTTLYTVPVVFHVIHANGAENVSDANIIAQMTRLNEDFRKMNADLSSCPASFQAIAGDALIQFKLATLDPNGNCTNGIERIYSHKTFNAGEDAKLNQWPRDKYLNIWVVNDIPSPPGSGPGTILAYALLPAVAAGFGAPYDGILMMASECNGTSRTLTHETGHFFNLPHVWGTAEVATTCGDDGVSDTPITKGHFSTCPAYDSTCVPGVLENINNYLDYSNCKRMFTQGQADRMRVCIESTTAQRSNLWIYSNLLATGTDSAAHPVCIPEPNFFANRYMICPGGTITFTQNTTNISIGVPTSFSWSFPGGTPSTSTLANPTVTYNTPGSYDVVLTVTNAGGTATETKTMLVTVSTSYAQVPNTYSEDFENPTEYYSHWTTVDLDNNSKTWWYTGTAGYSGSHSVVMNAYYNYPNDVDQLISPSYDLTFISSTQLTFRCAAATKATTSFDLTDKLVVYSSIDCGATWSIRKTLTGTAFINNGYHPEEFVASATSSWTLHTVNVPSTVCSPNTRFKFEYTSGLKGNSIYIDDINISGVLGVEDKLLVDANVILFPNPADQITTLSYSLNKRSDTQIEVVDLLGKKVLEVITKDEAEGEHRYEISKQKLNLLNGIYFVKLTVGNTIITKKMIFTE